MHYCRENCRHLIGGQAGYMSSHTLSRIERIQNSIDSYHLNKNKLYLSAFINIVFIEIYILVRIFLEICKIVSS
jgi:hypothetical protein